MRQSAVQDDTQELSCSPPRLGVRFLPTIPSAADSSIQLDDDTAEAHSSPSSCHSEPAICDADVEAAAGAAGSGPSGGGQQQQPQQQSMSPAPFYAILHAGNPQATVSSLKDKTKPP